MGQQTAFAVPKEHQNVIVRLDEKTALEGTIFLEYAPSGNTVHHKMAAFLEGATQFFPLKLKEGGKTEFIRKRNVRIIELSPGEDQELKLALSLMQTVTVTTVFMDESSISGQLMADVPAEKARLSDCLNLPNKFLTLKIDNKLCYLNKAKIRKVMHSGNL